MLLSLPLPKKLPRWGQSILSDSLSQNITDEFCWNFL